MTVINPLPCSYHMLPKIYKETKYCLIYMAVIKTLPCSYQVLPKIYMETKYCLIYGRYQDVTMQLSGVTKDI